MILEQQVCSLELAKRLKELGVKQHRTSLYKWQKRWFTIENPNDPSQNKVEEGDWAVMDAGPQYAAQPVRNPWWLKEVTRIEEEWYAAFTVAELGEMLRPHLKKSIWLASIRDAMEQATYMEDEAAARAKMLIYLLENNLLSTPN